MPSEYALFLQADVLRAGLYVLREGLYVLRAGLYCDRKMLFRFL